MDQACVSCHQEIALLVQNGRGYHARDGKGKCAACHPDHAGADFQLITWPDGSADRFDHRKTGWELKGKHADTKCADCHATKFRKGAVADASPRKHGAGWVGLETACVSCHEDPHRNSLGDRCTRCHDETKWKPAPLFQHDSSSYPLTGKHADVACDKCHLAPRLTPALDAQGKPVPVFKPVSHKDCVDCHADVHKGRLAGACAKCHVTTSFTTINKAGFDHDATRYPLRGEHTQVPCAKCHIGFPSAGMRPAFAHCTDCHKDAHGGRATLAGKVVDCDGCHTVQGFKPATYTVAQHARTKYPLEGKHATVACGACHKAKTVTQPAANGAAGQATTVRIVEMRPEFAKCTSCHADDHGGQLASRPDKGACESCHKVAGWTQSTYPLTEHASYKLPLEGKHAEIACGACHSAKRAGLPPMTNTATLGKARVAFKLREVECQACHVDPHRGKLDQYGACSACHGAAHFGPSTFDVTAHGKSAFALAGEHRAVPCVACHAEMKAPPMTSTLVQGKASFAAMTFAAKHETCAACHKSPHGTQFDKRKDKGACEGCHVVDAWSPAVRFDHGKDTPFALTGAHAKLTCGQCHTSPPGTPLDKVDYRGLSSKCESCHTQPVRQ